MASANTPDLKARAFRFVVMLGVVSLFADATYEGARSITGPFLSVLGASGAVVGIVAGAGELIGYGLRLLTGYLADRTRRYWSFTFAGYALNLLSVPLLALAGSWQVAAGLMLSERAGKAIRTPARDVILSQSTEIIGHGRGFGLHEAMDQIGAVIGPLLVAAMIASGGNYRLGFVVLLGPALLALAMLSLAARRAPPYEFAHVTPKPAAASSRQFHLLLLASAFLAAGYADFPLLAYHFQRHHIFAPTTIPLLYALAMAADALSALFFGRIFDRVGVRAVALSALLSAAFAPLAFLGGRALAVCGVVLWGVGMGGQESILRAAIAVLVPADKRGSAYGSFNAVFGIAWFAGSSALGILYDRSVMWVALLSALLQLGSVPLFSVAARVHPFSRPVAE